VWGAVASYMVREVFQVTGPKSISVRSTGVAVSSAVSRTFMSATARIDGVKKVAIRRTLGLGVVAGVVYAAWRTYHARVAAAPRTEGSWEAAPFPFPPIPRPAPAPPSHANATIAASSDAVDAVDGVCPTSHPVKGKLASGIFHEPGGRNYERTRADRCYIDADAAESDGLRPSKI
jgi:hypothetical protein